MNYSTAIFLISDDVRAVKATYEKWKDHEEDKKHSYIFKTLEQGLKVGDYVVVETDTRHGMTICKISEIDVEPDYDSSYDLKWVVAKVNKEAHDKLLEQEKTAIERVKKAEKTRKRKELRANMMEDAEEDIKKLELYTHKEEEKKEK